MGDRAVVKRKKEEVDSIAMALQKYEEGEMQEPPTEEVITYLKEVGEDNVLIAAAPAALQQPPSKRRSFDVITMGEIRKVLSKNAEALSTEMGAGAPSEAYASTEALGAWAIMDTTEDRVKEAQVALAQAKTALAKARKAEASAMAVVEAKNLVTSTALAHRTLAEEKVKEVMACFERLVQPADAMEMNVDAGSAADGKEVSNGKVNCPVETIRAEGGA